MWRHGLGEIYDQGIKTIKNVTSHIILRLKTQRQERNMILILKGTCSYHITVFHS